MSKANFLAGIVITLLFVVAGSTWAVEPEKPLDNAQVIQMTKADLGDSIIIAKVKSAKEVAFDLTTDDLVALKAAGVSKDVITAMLDRAAGNSPANSSASATAKVVLSTSSGEFDLKPVEGDVKTIVAPFVGMKRFIVFSDLNASTRTKDRLPSVVIATERNPSEKYWLVKLDQDDDEDALDRSLDVQSPGAWGGVLSSAPEDDFIVDCSVSEDKPGLWRFTPEKNLKPGEYALYTSRGEAAGTIYDFSVEK